MLKDVPGTWFTSHVNENPAEIAEVAALFADAEHYVDTYDRHGLVGPSTVLAHNVHATDARAGPPRRRGARRSRTARRATPPWAAASSRCASHVEHGVRVALGSDVGAGTGFSLIKEGLQAYFMQQLLGPGGLPLASPDLLHLATRAGALALGLGDEVGDLSVGRQFDAVWVRPLRRRPARRRACATPPRRRGRARQDFALGTPTRRRRRVGRRRPGQGLTPSGPASALLGRSRPSAASTAS